MEVTGSRPFRFWEQICSTMNISLAFELNGPVTDELLLKAWSLVKKEYPYFSSSITQDKTGQLVFVPPTKSQGAFIDMYTDIPLQCIKHQGAIDYKPLLVAFANTQRDHGRSLAHLELHSSGPNHHFLLATINHAGMDGVSTFHVFRSFFAKLGELATGSEPQVGSVKPNVDIGAHVPHMDVSRLKPLMVPAVHMPMLAPLCDAKNADAPAYVEAEFAELSAEETACLVAKCREQGATVQGAISAAAAIAIAQAQRYTKPLPQTLLMQCPANMRRQMTKADKVWDVARSCTQHIKQESEQQGGLAFWARMHASKTLPELATAKPPPYTPPYTITSSSVGVNPIPANNGPIQVQRTHMMLSTFGITSEKEAGTMTHAHTFNNRLHVTFTYSMPAVGHKRGKAMAATQMAVLKLLASNNGDAAVGDFME